MSKSRRVAEARIVGRSISLLYRKAQAFLNRELKPIDLCSSEYVFLLNIGDGNPVRQKSLSETLCMDTGLTTRCLKSLEKKGHIRRDPDPEDGRALLVGLTAKGRAARPAILAALEKWEAALTAGMSRRDVDAFSRLAATIAQNITKDDADASDFLRRLRHGVTLDQHGRTVHP